MGVITVAAFRPKPGREDELLGVIADRLPLLRSLGLATEREPVLCRAADGAIIEISEWASPEAIERAHETPEVHALWERFEACSGFISVRELGETEGPFATFEAINT